MANIATTRQYGAELLEALGIDTARVFKAVISIEVNDVIRVDLSRWADAPIDGKLQEIHSRYVVTATPYDGCETVDVTALDSTEREYRKVTT